MHAHGVRLLCTFSQTLNAPNIVSAATALSELTFRRQLANKSICSKIFFDNSSANTVTKGLQKFIWDVDTGDLVFNLILYKIKKWKILVLFFMQAKFCQL